MSDSVAVEVDLLLCIVDFVNLRILFEEFLSKKFVWMGLDWERFVDWKNLKNINKSIIDTMNNIQTFREYVRKNIRWRERDLEEKWQSVVPVVCYFSSKNILWIFLNVFM